MKTKDFVKQVYEKDINHFYILDIETTGRDSYIDGIIQASILEVQYGNAINSYDSLYNPGFLIDPFIAKLTGITNEDVKGKKEIINDSKFKNFFKKNLIIVAHNVAFVKTILRNNGVYLDEFTWIDSIYISKALFPGMENYKLNSLFDEHAKDNPYFNKRHNSLNDVHNLLHIILKGLNQIDDIDKLMNTPWQVPNFKTTDYEKEYNVNLDHLKKSIGGRVICFTGSLRVSRKAMVELIESNGATYSKGITQKVDLVVVGTEPGGKLQIAKDKGIEVINEDEFESMIN